MTKHLPNQGILSWTRGDMQRMYDSIAASSFLQSSKKQSLYEQGKEMHIQTSLLIPQWLFMEHSFYTRSCLKY